MVSQVVADARLVQIVDRTMDEATRLAGAHLACHKGCAVCCFGPFPITMADALRLQRGLQELSEQDSSAADAIHLRAREALSEMELGAALSPNGEFTISEDDEVAFAERFEQLPCPALNLASGGCLLYEHRPIACRIYGPPLMEDGVALPPCPLCFRGADASQIEAARVTLDDHGLAQELDDALAAQGIGQQRTLIAWALR